MGWFSYVGENSKYETKESFKLHLYKIYVLKLRKKNQTENKTKINIFQSY